MDYEERELLRKKMIFIQSIIVTFIIIGLLCIGLYAFPKWNVWKMGLSGEANLKKAQHEKLIMIEQAKAELEASKHRAAAIKVMGKMAQKYPEYRVQEFIGAFAEAMENGDIDKIIYVPTEANIPITEASGIHLK